MNHIHCGFIDFRPGYEYIYKLNATADVISAGKFLLRAKVSSKASVHLISYTNIREFLDSQELLLRVYDFQFTPIGQLDVRGHDFDFSSWFSFVIAKHGVILRVYHDEDDRDEVVAIKKGIAGLLSAKLHSEDEVHGTIKGGNYSYTTEEVGHEGLHTADYIVFPTAEGKAFKKTRTNFDHQVENAKSSYEKILHPLTVEKNIHVAWEAIKGNLTCMSNQPSKGRECYLSHYLNYGLYFKDDQMSKCTTWRKLGRSPELSTCFFDIVHVLKRLPAEHLDTIAEFYFTNLSSVYPDNAAARHNMLDAYGVLNTNHSQTILLQRVLLAPTLDEDLVQRVLVQVVSMKTPPIQNITTVIEEMAFDSTIGSRKISMTTCHRAQMTLGSVIRKMKENDDTYSKHLTDRMHGMLGIHDPWRYIQKRSTMTEGEQYDHDREKVVLLESLGNACMNHSYDYIISHINATNSPWIKRAGVHALRHYHHDDAADQLLLTALYDHDENVRFEALLQYQAHPKSRIITPLNNRAHPNDSYEFNPYSSGIQEVAVHHRDRRSLMNFMKLNLHFHLEAPGVDWRKELGTKDMGASFGIILKNMLDIKIAPLKGHLKIEVHDEAYARAHVGKSNFNIDFFVARLCFTGGAEYNLNIFQDFDPNLGFDLVKQFDALVKNVVGAIKTGIELFRDLISGNFLKTIVNGFVQALEELPNTVANLRTHAESVVAKLGRLNLEKLPSFIKPLKQLVTHVTNLFTDIKNDVMTFYNVSGL
ncbi:hypothetical protein CHS0354_024481 [Potamilus streckersoni]|uniref:Vitellogenin domain-containing protein n=1 Tax=Potamilus streckersoni TaxID=2493646 RepID=A0AAE0WHP5_9BIVA|nr:hypothetical protein CHS0354_024481 [Potamilus streckersoni]